VADFSDEELAHVPDDTPTRLLATLTDDQWAAIWKRRLESVVLDLAELSPDRLLGFLQSLTSPDAARPQRSEDAQPAGSAMLIAKRGWLPPLHKWP